MSDVGEELEAIAWSEDGVIMALRHKRLPIYGLQYHPESILSSNGKRVLSNFLESQPFPRGGGVRDGCFLKNQEDQKTPADFILKGDRRVKINKTDKTLGCLQRKHQ